MESTTRPELPFGVTWSSLRLYREVEGHAGDRTSIADELSGTRIEVDGWDEDLRAAWGRLVEAEDVRAWLAAYEAARGAGGLVVTFGDVPRVMARRAFGADYTVHYPADALLDAAHDAGARAAAMRAAIVAVLDKHVERERLDVPLLGALLER